MTSVESSPDLEFLRTLSVLYVEDEEDVREAMSRFLRRRFPRLDVAADGQEGLEKFRQGRHDIVVTDVRMPRMDGLEMARSIKSIQEEVPVIVVTAYNETDYFMRAIEVGVDRYVKKPVDPELLIDAIYKSTIVRFQARELENAKKRALDTLQQAVAALARAIENRDRYTDGHQKRVAQLAEAIATDMALSKDTITGVRLGALIHDVGNIRIPAEILSSPRFLTVIEKEIVKTHAEAGFEIVGDINFIWPIAEIIRQHHERLDGSGYPAGLKGDEISLEARIVAVADVVEGMSSHRPHRPSLGIQAALEEIRSQKGVRYDSAVVDSCIRVIEKAGIDFWDSAGAGKS